MDFVRITPDNVSIAHHINRVVFPKYDSLINFLDSFKEGAKDRFYLMKVGEEHVGIFGLYYYEGYPDDAWLGWFGVLPEHRGKGYGNTALTFFEDLARDRGFRYVRLFTDTYDNEEAHKFYLEHGFTEERYINENDPASLKYPISIFSKPLFAQFPLKPWGNRNIHFTKQVEKQR